MGKQTITKIHTFAKYIGGGNINIAGLAWLAGQVQRVWAASGTGASMQSAGYNASNAWGGTLTQLVKDEGYWIHAKTTGWELPSYLVKVAESNTAPAGQDTVDNIPAPGSYNSILVVARGNSLFAAEGQVAGMQIGQRMAPMMAKIGKTINGIGAGSNGMKSSEMLVFEAMRDTFYNSYYQQWGQLKTAYFFEWINEALKLQALGYTKEQNATEIYRQGCQICYKVRNKNNDNPEFVTPDEVNYGPTGTPRYLTGMVLPTACSLPGLQEIFDLVYVMAYDTSKKGYPDYRDYADWAVDMRTVKYLGQPGAALNRTYSLDNTGHQTELGEHIFAGKLVADELAYLGIPHPIDLTTINVTSDGTTITFTSDSVFPLEARIRGTVNSAWGEFTGENTLPDPGTNAWTLEVRMMFNTNVILTYQKVAAEDGSPEAPTFEEDDITPDSTFRLFHSSLPSAELELRDGSMAANTWVAYTAHPAYNSLKDYIEVGNVAHPAQYYQGRTRAVTGRPAGQIGYSKAFTVSTGPVDSDVTAQIAYVTGQGGRIGDSTFLNNFVAHTKAAAIWPDIAIVGSLATGWIDNGSLAKGFGLNTPDLSSPTTARRAEVITGAEGRSVFNFEGQLVDDSNNQAYGWADTLAGGMGDSAVLDGVVPMTMVTVGKLSPRAPLSWPNQYGSALLNYADTYQACIGTDATTGGFMSSRAAASNGYIVHPTPNTGQGAIIVSRFNPADNNARDMWVADASGTVKAPTLHAVDPTPLTVRGVYFGAALHMGGVLGQGEFYMILKSSPSDAEIVNLINFLKTYYTFS